MDVIDFRIRPPYKTYHQFVEMVSERNTSQYGFRYEGSLKTKQFEDFMEELDRANVVKAVLPGRYGMGMRVDNRELFELADQYPDRFIVFPFIDPLEGRRALDAVDELIIRGKGKGVALEPGYPPEGSDTYKFDDARVYPFYKKLEDNEIPILLTYSSYALEDYDVDSPRQLDRVAKDFPALKIVVGHAGWPWTLDNIGIAMHRPNVYLSPDIYGINGPGADDYIRAAGTMLKDQFIFGSSYPLIPVDQTVEFIKREWGLDEETLEKVLYKNAAKVLKL